MSIISVCEVSTPGGEEGGRPQRWHVFVYNWEITSAADDAEYVSLECSATFLLISSEIQDKIQTQHTCDNVVVS